MTPNEIIESQIKALTIYDANNTCLTVKDCAKFLGVCEKTMRNWINDDKIKNVQIEGRTMIPKIQFLKQLI